MRGHWLCNTRKMNKHYQGGASSGNYFDLSLLGVNNYYVLRGMYTADGKLIPPPISLRYGNGYFTEDDAISSVTYYSESGEEGVGGAYLTVYDFGELDGEIWTPIQLYVDSLSYYAVGGNELLSLGTTYSNTYANLVTPDFDFLFLKYHFYGFSYQVVGSEFTKDGISGNIPYTGSLPSRYSLNTFYDDIYTDYVKPLFGKISMPPGVTSVFTEPYNYTESTYLTGSMIVNNSTINYSDSIIRQFPASQYIYLSDSTNSLAWYRYFVPQNIYTNYVPPQNNSTTTSYSLYGHDNYMYAGGGLEFFTSNGFFNIYWSNVYGENKNILLVPVPVSFYTKRTTFIESYDTASTH